MVLILLTKSRFLHKKMAHGDLSKHAYDEPMPPDSGEGKNLERLPTEQRREPTNAEERIQDLEVMNKMVMVMVMVMRSFISGGCGRYEGGTARVDAG